MAVLATSAALRDCEAGAASKGTSANGKRDSIAWKSANALQIATISMDRSLLLWNIPNKSGRPEWKAGKVGASEAFGAMPDYSSSLLGMALRTAFICADSPSQSALPIGIVATSCLI